MWFFLPPLLWLFESKSQEPRKPEEPEEPKQDIHRYFINRFEECIHKVDKMDLHRCDNNLEALKGLAERFHWQEQWVLKLSEKIDKLEKQLGDKRETNKDEATKVRGT